MSQLDHIVLVLVVVLVLEKVYGCRFDLGAA
jgi:hypothetical protein